MRSPRLRHTLLRGTLATMLCGAFLLSFSCGLVPYEENGLKGYLFSEELTEIGQIGPSAFEADSNNDENRIPWPQELHPTAPFGSSGYAVWSLSSRVYAYYVGGSSSQELTDQWVEERQVVRPYVARVANVDDPNNPEEKPFLFAPFQGGFGRIEIYNSQGFVDEINLLDLLGSAGFVITNPRIVGIYFRSIDETREELAVLVREDNAATFKEAYFTLGANATLSGPTVPGGGTFTLPNLTDDIVIYNGAFVRDPVNGFNFLTVQDDYDYITYRWDENNPATSRTELPIDGVVSHATPEGTLMVREGDRLIEYDSSGGVLKSYEPGTIVPIGIYWTGSSVDELYSAVGLSLAIPEARITARIYRR